MHDIDAVAESFVRQKRLKLEEVPAMDLTTNLLPKVASVTYAGQLLQHNRTASRKRIHNLFADTMIHVFPKPLFLATKGGKVSFSGA